MLAAFGGRVWNVGIWAVGLGLVDRVRIIRPDREPGMDAAPLILKIYSVAAEEKERVLEDGVIPQPINEVMEVVLDRTPHVFGVRPKAVFVRAPLDAEVHRSRAIRVLFVCNCRICSRYSFLPIPSNHLKAGAEVAVPDLEGRRSEPIFPLEGVDPLGKEVVVGAQVAILPPGKREASRPLRPRPAESGDVQRRPSNAPAGSARTRRLLG